MNKPIYEKILDVLMFREGSEADSDTNEPQVTTGSIVWGLLLRSAIIIIFSFLLLEKLEFRQYWWLVVFILWFGAAWPAYRQYQKYQQRMKRFVEDTLCGTCRHFDSSSQLCKIYDEHVSRNYVPCEGLSWEPRHFDSDD